MCSLCYANTNTVPRSDIVTVPAELSISDHLLSTLTPSEMMNVCAFINRIEEKNGEKVLSDAAFKLNTDQKRRRRTLLSHLPALPEVADTNSQINESAEARVGDGNMEPAEKKVRNSV